MVTKKCKICRRLGEKFFIKGERCFSSKCASLRKTVFKRDQRHRRISEFGLQLKEKQKLKLLYGLREKQLKNYVLDAFKKKHQDASAFLIQSLERRLDNIVYRLGFALSRASARQIVNHGHILVNGKKVSIPSFKVNLHDKISIKEKSRGKHIFKNLDITLKKHATPPWLKLDKTKKEGEVLSLPSDPGDYQINTTAITEFYLK